MTRPNLLVLMVDRLNGTLLSEGPGEWLHGRNLRRRGRRPRPRRKASARVMPDTMNLTAVEEGERFPRGE